MMIHVIQDLVMTQRRRSSLSLSFLFGIILLLTSCVQKSVSIPTSTHTAPAPAPSMTISTKTTIKNSKNEATTTATTSTTAFDRTTKLDPRKIHGYNYLINLVRYLEQNDTNPTKSNSSSNSTTNDTKPSSPVRAPSVASIQPSTTLPTYSVKCAVCGNDNDENDRTILKVSYPWIKFKFFDEQLQCGASEIAGNRGLVPTNLCPILQLSVQANCQCENVTTTSNGKNNTDNNKDVPTYSPMATSYPTRTLQPTKIEPCYICGSKYRYVANPKTKLVVFDQETNCQKLETYARDVGLDASTCAVVAQQAYRTCRCSNTAAPTPLVTLQPTATQIPTVTAGPTYLEQCNLCNDPNQAFPRINDTTTYANETLAIRGKLYHCTALQQSADDGFVSPTACDEIRLHNDQVVSGKKKPNKKSVYNQTGCTCIGSSSSAAATTPTVSSLQSIIGIIISTALLISTVTISIL